MRPGSMGLAALALAVALGCGGGAAPPSDQPLPPSDPEMLEYADELAVVFSQFERTESGLYMQDLEIGDGPFARTSGRVWVRYVGWLPDGTVVDANVRGDPLRFRLGAGQVIEGWNEGIVGMRRGGKRRLIVPPSLGYGSRGRGRIPPGATLVFYIEVLEVD